MTQYLENAGAKLRYPVYSYHSAQTAYHDAHRGRGRGKIANNTYITEVDGDYCVVLHRTPIVCYHPDNSFTLRSGGHRTVTTKARMNEVLPPGIGVYQHKHEWYLHHPKFLEDVEFFDGMRVAEDGTVWDTKTPRTNPPRIVYRAGEGRAGPLAKVYWDSEFQEYEVRHEREQAGEGYFTTDKQDAIDTADMIVTSKGMGRKNPPYKGKLGEMPEDRFAYRGYLVRKRLAEQYWDISKDGFHIGGAPSPEDARRIIAELTQDSYMGEQ